MGKGLIQVYTSESEQFNFAPMGLSLRAAGQGLRTLITSFTPYDFMAGASVASSLLEPYLTVDHTAIDALSSYSKGSSTVQPNVAEVFDRSREAAFSGAFDVVILNGILDLLARQLLPLKGILNLLDQRLESVELVLSGSRANEEIIERADLVTEMVVNKPEGSLPGIPPENGHGAIEVITGEGKGKTTYCLGKAMLMSCLMIPTLIFQVIKSPSPYGEIKAIRKLPNLTIKTMGKGFLNVHASGLEQKHIDAARQAWKLMRAEIHSSKYGLVILDEINIATYYGLIGSERVLQMLFSKPPELDLILTGRHAHPAVTKAASSVIEMREIKHPFAKGIQARKGIEY
ncbi:MAG: cob(I)yrinic acid a,c-diamide adenosyltransferase [Deltaproteobacteria bacterium]